MWPKFVALSYVLWFYNILCISAPWDTDSEEEDSYKIPKAGQVSSADEDDFDFYD